MAPAPRTSDERLRPGRRARARPVATRGSDDGRSSEIGDLGTSMEEDLPLRWTRELLDLLEECDVIPYRGSGPGGQRKNKKETAVRVVHRPTGITRLGTESRSQSANKLLAVSRIHGELARRSRPKKVRKASRRTAESEIRRIREKRSRSLTKQNRNRPERVDD